MTALLATGLAIDGRLNPTDLSAEAGQAIALIGPNGGGKTSLLRALARVESADGEVTIAGENVDQAPPARRRRLLSLLPASRDLAWPIAVRGVVALGLARPSLARIEHLLEQFELSDLSNRPANSLSTGERSRVLMARALASEPQVLLLDEPLANLEPYWVLKSLDILRTFRNAGGVVMMALHDLDQLSWFDRALLVAGGRVQMDETPAGMVASERFEEIFRVRRGDTGQWALTR